MVKEHTSEKVSTVILKARQDRKSMDSKATSYIESVGKKNRLRDSITHKTLEQVLSDLRISERVFRDSMLNIRVVEPGLRFIELRGIVPSRRPQLQPEEIMSILSYYMKSMKTVLDMNDTNQMEGQLLSHIGDDTIYWKFGLERSQVMEQARDMAESHEGVRNFGKFIFI